MSRLISRLPHFLFLFYLILQGMGCQNSPGQANLFGLLFLPITKVDSLKGGFNNSLTNDNAPSDITILPGSPFSSQDFTSNGITVLNSVWSMSGSTLDANVYVLAKCATKNQNGSPNIPDWIQNGANCDSYRSEINIEAGSRLTLGHSAKSDSIRLFWGALVDGILEGNQFKVPLFFPVPNKKSPLGALPYLPNFLRGTTGGQDLQDPINNLSPGIYNNLTLSWGKILNLSGGYYHFNKIYLAQGSILICNSTCIVMVKDRIELLSGSKLQITSLNPDDFVFYVDGNPNNELNKQDTSILKNASSYSVSNWEQYKYPSVTFWNGVEVIADIYAPFGRISWESGSVGKGVFISRDMRLSYGSKIQGLSGNSLSDVNYSEINLNINQIQFVSENDSLFSYPANVSAIQFLSSLQNNSLAESFSFPKVPEGNYKEIRLLVGDGNSITKGNTNLPLKIVSSGVENGFKINGVFTLRGGKITEIRFAVNSDNSLLNNFDREYIWKPSYQIVSVKSMSALQDQILSQLGNPDADSTALFQESDIIISANANSLQALDGILNGSPVIYTDVAVNVNEILKDKSNQLLERNSFNVRQLGGTIGDRWMYATHVARFKPGERSLLFLKKFGSDYITVQGESGKWNY